MRQIILLLFLHLIVSFSYAGNQAEEKLSTDVRTALHKAVSDNKAPKLSFANQIELKNWLNEMSRRLIAYIPDETNRINFLSTVYYEAQRAGVDPQLVLGIIQIESTFNKYAVSKVGARGYMQVMPFWVELIGDKDHNLFHLRTNLRYGCAILRHYLNIEKGDFFRALARYNGSLGRREYPLSVINAWQNSWHYSYTPEVIEAKTESSPSITPEIASTIINK